eukprot:654011-Pyramimonas_sp.AAC.1
MWTHVDTWQPCAGCGGRMWTLPLKVSVELPMGPRSAVLGGGLAFGHRHLGLRWSSPWGHEAPCSVGEKNVDTATGGLGGAPYERCAGWGRRTWTPPLGPSVGLQMWPRSA